MYLLRGIAGSGKTWRAREEVIKDANAGRTVVVIAECDREYLQEGLTAKLYVNNWGRVEDGVNVFSMPTVFDDDVERIKFLANLLETLNRIPAGSTVVIEAMDKILSSARELLSEKGYEAFERNLALRIAKLSGPCKVIITAQNDVPEALSNVAKMIELRAGENQNDTHAIV